MSAVQAEETRLSCLAAFQDADKEDATAKASCCGVQAQAQLDTRQQGGQKVGAEEAPIPWLQSYAGTALTREGVPLAKASNSCLLGSGGLCGDAESVSRQTNGVSQQENAQCGLGSLLSPLCVSDPDAHIRQWNQRAISIMDTASSMERAGQAVRQALCDDLPEKAARGAALTVHDSTSSLASFMVKPAAKDCPYFNPYGSKAESADGKRCEDDAFLNPEWEINPHDVIFCAKKNGNLVKLGKGAFGTVYKGMWQGQAVAVKVCKQDKVNDRAMQQFRKEVAILHAHQNEGLVQFKGACIWEGGKRMVLVTEYMSKGDVYSALGRNPERYCWHGLGPRIALDVAKALLYLHDRDIVHFDLKSGNILLTKGNRAKLADVGLAKLLTQCHNADHLCTIMSTGDIGTFAWAAPEVLLGNPCDQSADIFSFGVLLWELVTTEVPRSRCLRPLKVPEECSESVVELVAACMRHSPEKRPTAAQLVDILSSL